MTKIDFKITTPEREVYAAEVDQVTLPTVMGEITVLPHHIPLIGMLKPGELRIKSGGDEEILAVSGGFVEVGKNKIVILADTAEMAAEIDVEKVEEAKQRAETLLREQKIDSQEYAALQVSLERELVRLKVGRKYRKLKGIHTTGKANQ